MSSFSYNFYYSSSHYYLHYSTNNHIDYSSNYDVNHPANYDVDPPSTHARSYIITLHVMLVTISTFQDLLLSVEQELVLLKVLLVCLPLQLRSSIQFLKNLVRSKDLIGVERKDFNL